MIHVSDIPKSRKVEQKATFLKKTMGQERALTYAIDQMNHAGYEAQRLSVSDKQYDAIVAMLRWLRISKELG